MQLLVAYLSCIFGLFILVLSGTTLCNFSPIQRFVFCTQNWTHFPGWLLLYSIRLVQYRLQYISLINIQIVFSQSFSRSLRPPERGRWANLFPFAGIGAQQKLMMNQNILEVKVTGDSAGHHVHRLLLQLHRDPD